MPGCWSLEALDRGVIEAGVTASCALAGVEKVEAGIVGRLHGRPLAGSGEHAAPVPARRARGPAHDPRWRVMTGRRSVQWSDGAAGPLLRTEVDSDRVLRLLPQGSGQPPAAGQGGSRDVRDLVRPA